MTMTALAQAVGLSVSRVSRLIAEAERSEGIPLPATQKKLQVSDQLAEGPPLDAVKH